MIARAPPNKNLKRTGLTSDRLRVALCGVELSDSCSIFGDKMLGPSYGHVEMDEGRLDGIALPRCK
jgi:hypothetical protein